MLFMDAPIGKVQGLKCKVASFYVAYTVSVELVTDN